MPAPHPGQFRAGNAYDHRPEYARPRLEFGHLACVAGLGPCHCPLCQIEAAALELERDLALYGEAFVGRSGRVRPDHVVILDGRAYDARTNETVTALTSFSQGPADTISNAERFRQETQMENLELFNPRAKDGALLWVALRMIPVSMILAGIFAALS